MVWPDYKFVILLILSIPAALAQTIEIDDGDAGYADTGWTLAVGQGFMNDVHFIAAGNGTQTANWTPSINVTGNYNVYVSWTVHSNRATNAPYIVNHDGGSAAFFINQELLANGSSGSSGEWSGWRFLATLHFDGIGMESIVLNDNANEYVIADAVRFVKIGGTTLYVDDDGLCGGNNTPCFTSLQSAINNATAGDTILVYPGTYTEPTISCDGLDAMFCVDKSNIRIRGDSGDPEAGCGLDAPIIDGNGTAASAFIIDEGVSNVIIEGFDIRNFNNPGCCTGGIGSGITAWDAHSSNITIQNNCLHDLGWNGVLVGSDDGSTQTGWLVRKNTIWNFSQTAIELTNTNDSLVVFNEITGPFAITSWDIGDAGVGIEIAVRDFGGTGISAHGINVVGNKINGIFAADSRAGINILSRAYLSTSNAVLDGVEVRDNTVEGSGTRGVYAVAESRNGGIANITRLEIQKNNLKNNTAGVKLGLLTSNPARVDGTYNRVYIGWDWIKENIIGIDDNVTVIESKIEKNIIDNNEIGIWLREGARDNKVVRNTITNNDDGIVVDGDNNKISDNILENNSGATGVHVNAAANNTQIIRNFFINNAPQANDSGTSTAWNNTLKGNCWSDFKLNPGFPHTYIIDNNSIDFRPCGVNAIFTGYSSGGGLIKIQDFISFKKNTTSISATLREKNGILSGGVRIRLQAKTPDGKDVYANIMSNPDTLEQFDSGLIKVSGIGMLNKIVRFKGKVIEEEDHNVNLTVWMNKTSANAVAYTGSYLELNITGAKVRIFNFREIR